MTTTAAPGLTASWLNSWMAAIGITILIPETRLSWTLGPNPRATLHHSSKDVAALIATGLPTPTAIQTLVVARTTPAAANDLKRNVDLPTYQQRAAIARSTGDPTLSACVTDLHRLRDDGEVDHSPFDPPASQGKTMWDRLVACRGHLPETPTEQVRASLAGAARRVRANGLGFDHRRFLSPADPVGNVWIDPVIELLAFIAMTVLPARGDGRNSTFRGWAGRASQEGAFTWPVWDQPLTSPAIDALLDAYWSDPLSTTTTSAYATVPYVPRASMDQTRGYASRPADD